MEYTYTITRTLKEEVLLDVLTTAIEGGIGYWACLLNDDKDWVAARKQWKTEHNDTPCYCDVALQVMKKCPDAISIFLLPPSMEQLEDRIRGRGSETEASIEKRMKRAVEEIELSNNFNYRITNDDIDKCADKIKEIILKEVNKSS